MRITRQAISAFGGALTVDRFSLFFNAIFLVTTALVAAVSQPDIRTDFPEYLTVMLFAQSGMFILAGGADLITLFLGLELMALSFYILAGFARESRRSNEAALKFLILGARFRAAWWLMDFPCSMPFPVPRG